MRHSEAFFLKRTATHDKRLAASDLVVDDTTSQKNIHPDGILLTGIQIFYSETFTVEAREIHVRTVVMRPYETVEFAVVGIRQSVFEFYGLIAEPVGESAPDFINLAVCQLDFLTVPDLDLNNLSIHEFFDLFGNVWNGVVQSVFEQV